MQDQRDSGSIAVQAVITALLHRLYELDPESQPVFSQALEEAAASLEDKARSIASSGDLIQLREALEVVEEIRVGMVRGTRTYVS